MAGKKTLISGLLLTGLVGASLAFASSHREAPGIAKDPTADNTDVYAFRSPDKPSTATLIANWLPIAEPAGGPNFFQFDDKAVYQIHVANEVNGRHIVYEFYFKTTIRNPKTFLYNTGQITSPTDSDLNLYQTYSVKKVVDGSGEWIGRDLRTQPNRVGPKSTPSINDLATKSIYDLSDGSKVFAGERDDPFFVDTGALFDLLTIRKLPGDQGEGVDGLRGFNVLTIALQVPIKELAKSGHGDGDDDDANIRVGTDSHIDANYPIIAVYASTERGGKRVSRLGSPLVNEVVIPLGDKDKWNASDPKDDGQFLQYVTDPEPARLLKALYNINVPPTPRNDLVAVFLTGVKDLNQPRNGTPSEKLRLNLKIEPSSNPSRLGVLGGDLAGFPNGRRLADDVTDIELRALAGVLVPGFNVAPNNRLGDGVDFNERAFLTKFPYVAFPHDGYAHNHHRTEPAVGSGPVASRAGSEAATEEVAIFIEDDDYVAGMDAEPMQVRGEMPAKRALLRYALSRDANVTLRIFDVQGRNVKTLVDEHSKAGAVDVQWDGSDDFGSTAGKGVFFARYSVDGKLVNTKKLVIR